MTAWGRWSCALLFASAVMVVRAPQSAAAPAAGSSLGVPLRPAPAGAPGDLGGTPCLPVVGCDPLGGLGADAATVMARAVFDAFATFVADGVRTVLDQVSLAITKTTEVKFDRDWFQQHILVMRSLAILALLPMVLIGLISAVIHRDAGQLLRAGGVYVPVAVIGGVASIVLTERALQVTDWATSVVTGDLTGSTTSAMGALKDAIQTVTSAGAPGLGYFLAIVVLLVLMAGAILIWIELLLRTGAIYVVVLFLPLAMSGLVWRATVSWTRRMVEVLVALILSKFVIVVVIDLAAGMITAGDGIGTIMQGATLLLLAACAPFALLRLVPIVEAGVIGQLERMERRPLAAATRATAGVARQLMTGVEAVTASQAVAGNGGDAYAVLSDNREPGGQLNDIQLPDGWDRGDHSGPASGSPPPSAGSPTPPTALGPGPRPDAPPTRPSPTPSARDAAPSPSPGGGAGPTWSSPKTEDPRPPVPEAARGN